MNRLEHIIVGSCSEIHFEYFVFLNYDERILPLLTLQLEIKVHATSLEEFILDQFNICVEFKIVV